ncbi:hypothetical protein [Amycolatopsis sp. NBC_01286]|uniref:hypothetical protein n=1 Tax=Amycolatopsis sp. NBC_01286 TaxID=2903560 RepID=UPI002E13F487|nr:hypothetical protein OG570_16905 [Amycolatopsis sp. NBC_01286]
MSAASLDDLVTKLESIIVAADSDLARWIVRVCHLLHVRLSEDATSAGLHYRVARIAGIAARDARIDSSTILANRIIDHCLLAISEGRLEAPLSTLEELNYLRLQL